MKVVARQDLGSEAWEGKVKNEGSFIYLDIKNKVEKYFVMVEVLLLWHIIEHRSQLSQHVLITFNTAEIHPDVWVGRGGGVN